MPRRGENIRKRKDGRWEGRYYVQESGTGKHIQRSVYAKSYGEVKEKLSYAKISQNKQLKTKRQEQNFYINQVAEEWLARVRDKKKYSTYVKYCQVYRKHLYEKLGKLTFSELNGKFLTSVFQSKEKEIFSESLQRSISCVLNQILSYAISHYQIHLSHYAFSGNKTRTKHIEVLNRSEQTRLLRYLYSEMDICKLGIIVCISTGLRLGELCALKWQDIDFEENLLFVNATVQRIAIEGDKKKTMLVEGEPKSIFSQREIPIPDELADMLLSYRNRADKYVINGKKPMEPRTYQNRFQKYLQFAEIKKKNFHILRHTFATNCVESGMDIKSLSEILGHSDVKITLNRYVHPTTEIKRQHMNSLAAIYGPLMGQK